MNRSKRFWILFAIIEGPGAARPGAIAYEDEVDKGRKLFHILQERSENGNVDVGRIKNALLHSEDAMRLATEMKLIAELVNAIRPR